MLGSMKVPGGEEVLGLGTEAAHGLLSAQQPLTNRKQPEGSAHLERLHLQCPVPQSTVRGEFP